MMATDLPFSRNVDHSKGQLLANFGGNWCCGCGDRGVGRFERFGPDIYIQGRFRGVGVNISWRMMTADLPFCTIVDL